MRLLLMLSCDADPCAWSHGEWEQTGVSHRGVDIASPDFDATLALGPDAFGYRPDGAAPLEPAILEAVDPDCQALTVDAGGQRYVLRQDDQDLLLEDGPRSFRFRRDAL